MLGLAIGEALGNPTEAKRPRDRRKRYGEITDYITKRRMGDEAVPSDDTQLAYWTLEQLLADDGRVVPEHLLDRFESREIFGIGQAVSQTMDDWHSARQAYTQADVAAAAALPPEITVLVQEREAARRLCDWPTADSLREELERRGYRVEDTEDGPALSVDHARH